LVDQGFWFLTHQLGHSAAVGIDVGSGVGAVDGTRVGKGVEIDVGSGVGAVDGTRVGKGDIVGRRVGEAVETGVGSGVGSVVGKNVGAVESKVGLAVGENVGAGVGAGESNEAPQASQPSHASQVHLVDQGFGFLTHQLGHSGER